MTQREGAPGDQPATGHVVDIEFLLDLLNGNREMARQMVTMFIQHTPKALDEVARAFRERDWSMLTFKVHAIKSYYAYTGNRALSARLNEWESALRQSQADFNHEEALRDLEVSNEAVIRCFSHALEKGEI